MPDANSIALPPRVKDLTGQQFGRLTVLEYVGSQCRQSRWLCRCKCGTTREFSGGNLSKGMSQSCGCLSRERTILRSTTHGQRKTTEYQSWAHIIGRCTNANNSAYDRYGGRGIVVCERWRTSFEAFLADMGPKPDGHRISIERKDNDGNYEPGNCIWATQQRQARNRSNNRNLTFNGKTQCVSAWAEELGMPPDTLKRRILAGWSVDRALSTPVRHCRRASASSAAPKL